MFFVAWGTKASAWGAWGTHFSYTCYTPTMPRMGSLDVKVSRLLIVDANNGYMNAIKDIKHKTSILDTEKMCLGIKQ